MATSIQGIQGLTPGELRHQIDLGGRFVYYKYTISVVVLTLRRASNIYFIKPGESPVVKGLGWTALTFFFGWWGIPWGPIFSVGTLWTNLRGGVDVTAQAVASLGLNGSGVVPNMTATPPPAPATAPPPLPASHPAPY